MVDQSALNKIIATCLSSKKNTGILYEEDFRYLIQKNDEGTKNVFADRTDEISRLSSLIQNSVLVGIGSLIVFYFMSLFLAKWAVKPIEKSWQQQRQFVADASHELKTPLTVILANTDIVLANKEKTVGEEQKWIDYIKIEAQRMTSLVNDMLYLAKTDGGRSNVVFSEVNLSDTVWSCILPFESVAFEQGKTIENNIENDIVLQGRESELRQLIGILVDNAIKYASDKGQITVALSQIQEKIKFSVNNTGEPIPEEQLGLIFERFYRVDKSRVRKKDGYGLGLSIAKSIVDAHHGRISVTSTVQSGTTFTVIFQKPKSIIVSK